MALSTTLYQISPSFCHTIVCLMRGVSKMSCFPANYIRVWKELFRYKVTGSLLTTTSIILSIKSMNAHFLYVYVYRFLLHIYIYNICPYIHIYSHIFTNVYKYVYLYSIYTCI